MTYKLLLFKNKSRFLLLVTVLISYSLICKVWAEQVNVSKYRITMQIPLDNISTVDKSELGKLLFYDKKLSADRKVSCSSCHDPEHYFASSEKLSMGAFGLRTLRNTPSILNAGYYPILNMDGSAVGLETQIIYPLFGQREMAMSESILLERLTKKPLYKEKFQNVFGVRSITLENVVKSIASYERTLTSLNSAFDHYISGDKKAISNAEKKGWKVFQQNCITCHSYSINQPFFSDFEFYNHRLETEKTNKDIGRYHYSHNAEDKEKFRTAPLRNVAHTAPYMHDGQFNSLAEVVNFYNTRIINTALNEEEISDLLAFLHIL